mmetsp:Transcript_13470/g.41716  ORF Transcript_13470/g.41716 Transcript_13470/m.41716 type:complete len:434 (-) Transcript_13470:80-1381(-)
MLLELYAGGLGRSLDMQVVSTPLLRIGGDGQTLTRTRLRWGNRHDLVILRGELALVGPTRLREVPRSVHSSALGLRLPALQSARDVRMTYYDGELLILRDDRGIVDLLWRQPGGQASRAEEGEAPAAEQPAAEAAEAGEGPGGPSPGEDAEERGRASQVAGEVERLKDMLEELRSRAAKEHLERGRLTQEVSHLEEALATACTNSQAGAMKLDVMERLLREASEATERQQQRSREKLCAQAELGEEVARLQGQVAGLEQTIGRCRAGEASLRAQIETLERELQVGPRNSWPACRAALSQARAELKTVQREFREAKKAVATLQRDVGQKSQQLQRRSLEAQAEGAASAKLEEELQERRRELGKQKELLSKAVATEEALRGELGSMRAELADLEAREAEGQELAAAVEQEMKVAEAQRAAKRLKVEQRQRSWPWR